MSPAAGRWDGPTKVGEHVFVRDYSVPPHPKLGPVCKCGVYKGNTKHVERAASGEDIAGLRANDDTHDGDPGEQEDDGPGEGGPLRVGAADAGLEIGAASESDDADAGGVYGR